MSRGVIRGPATGGAPPGGETVVRTRTAPGRPTDDSELREGPVVRDVDCSALAGDLASWIRAQVAGGCDRINLCHRVHEETFPVMEWRTDATTNADVLVGAIGRDFAREPGLYCLFSYRGASPMHSDRKLFRVGGLPVAADPSDFPFDRDEDDDRTAFLRSLRHVEAASRFVLEQTLAILEEYRRLLRERDARIAQLEQRMLDMIKPTRTSRSRPTAAKTRQQRRPATKAPRAGRRKSR